MKEISDIIIAFGQAQKEGKRTALATVVHVDGSSYRRPGNSQELSAAVAWKGMRYAKPSLPSSAGKTNW